MKSKRELFSLIGWIIILMRILKTLAGFVIVLGIIYEFVERDDIGVRLAIAGMGVLLITWDKTEVKYWRDLIRVRRRRRRARNIRGKMRKFPPEQPK